MKKSGFFVDHGALPGQELKSVESVLSAQPEGKCQICNIGYIISKARGAWDIYPGDGCSSRKCPTNKKKEGPHGWND
jgi:hypothetical protein